MIEVNDIKNGMTLLIEGQIYQVIDFLHVKPGKGAAFMKTKLKNLRTGGTLEKTFNTSLKFEKANLSKTNAQYLYASAEPAVKGNTTNNATKDAEVETGMTVRVPLFIEEGENIVISTKDGKYVSRA